MKNELIHVSPTVEKADLPAEKVKEPQEKPPRLDDFIRSKARAFVGALVHLKDLIVTSIRQRIAKWEEWDRGIAEHVEHIRGAKRRRQRTLDEERADPTDPAQRIKIALEQQSRVDEIFYQACK